MKIRKNVHLFPSTRRKTRHLSRRRKFEIFSETRLPKLLKVMKSVGNLSNQRYYEYKDWEKIKIMKDIREGYSEMYRAWKTAGKVHQRRKKKKSYWEPDNGNN
jgi:hypothetical protein|tara:strand:- start:988 stop:1296 length:309 start_codon:yes stop_codon:yes gene_type:complete